MGEFVRGDGKIENFIQIVSVVKDNKRYKISKEIGNAKRYDKMVSALSQDTKPALQIAKQ